MSQQQPRRARVVMIAMLILAALASTPARASSMVQYKIWYFDDNFDWFEEGDVSVGNVKLDPPAWACAIRFYDPSYYQFVDTYENMIESADFFQDVRVYLPNPGCPESEVVIKLVDGTLIPYEIGASYLEISTFGAFNWLDADGSNHACGFACVGADSLTYFPADHEIVGLRSSIDSVQGTLFVPWLQTVVPTSIAALYDRTRQLENETRKQVSARRRYDLGERESSVRALEDAAIRKLVEAGRKLEESGRLALGWRMPEAFVAAETGSDGVAAAQQLLRVAELSFKSASK